MALDPDADASAVQVCMKVEAAPCLVCVRVNSWSQLIYVMVSFGVAGVVASATVTCQLASMKTQRTTSNDKLALSVSEMARSK